MSSVYFLATVTIHFLPTPIHTRSRNRCGIQKGRARNIYLSALNKDTARRAVFLDIRTQGDRGHETCFSFILKKTARSRALRMAHYIPAHFRVRSGGEFLVSAHLLQRRLHSHATRATAADSTIRRYYVSSDNFLHNFYDPRGPNKTSPRLLFS